MDPARVLWCGGCGGDGVYVGVPVCVCVCVCVCGKNSVCT
jgi:hypothetical protein